MNVIPLIDVMLVLLAIVLMTASFIVKDNLNLELPETENTQNYIPPEDRVVLHFHIDAQNQYYLNEQPVLIEDIKINLKQLSKEQPITLQVDKNANFGSFVTLIDAFKGENLNNLNILTQSAEK